MRSFRSFLAYLLVSLALAFLTITVLNEFNPMMSFLTSKVSKILIVAFCLTAIVNGALHLHDD